MIKARGTTSAGRGLLIIGLSRTNTERLLENMPIRFAGEEFGFDGDVIILGGETEADIAEDLRALGPVKQMEQR